MFSQYKKKLYVGISTALIAKSVQGIIAVSDDTEIILFFYTRFLLPAVPPVTI